MSAARRLIVGAPRVAFTIDELTTEAEVAKGSFYNHFHDRDDIVEAVHRAVREREEEQVRTTNMGVIDPVARIARGIAVYAGMAVSSPEDASILTLAPFDDAFLRSDVNAGLRDDLEAALRDGRIVVPSIEAAALLVVANRRDSLPYRSGAGGPPSDRHLVRIFTVSSRPTTTTPSRAFSRRSSRSNRASTTCSRTPKLDSIARRPTCEPAVKRLAAPKTLDDVRIRWRGKR